MAKQRPQSRPKGRQSAHVRRPTPGEAALPTRTERSEATPQAPVPQPVVRRSTYVEAVAQYEQGVQALQQHDYERARQLLESVLTRFPEEKELQERVRLYLNVCERQAHPQEPVPQSVDERLFAATLAINEGRYDEAIAHLRLVRDEDPDNDHALYMLAVAHAQRGELRESLAHLERSIVLNPENRALARRDPDLDPLRDDESFLATLETPSRALRAEASSIKVRPKNRR
jgi:tetratricopeptide (TPR) repeat protein